MQAIEPMAGSPALVTQLQNVTAGVPAVMTQRVKHQLHQPHLNRHLANDHLTLSSH